MAKAGRLSCQSRSRLKSSAGEKLGMFGPARGCPGIRAWGAWAGCGHFEVVSLGVWRMFVYFMAILGVSEAGSRTNIAIVSLCSLG